MTIAAATLGRLRWRARRGTLEMDAMLERWLQHRAELADPTELSTFERLLACEDHLLQRWFLAYQDCPDAELAALVEAIRALPAN